LGRSTSQSFTGKLQPSNSILMECVHARYSATHTHAYL